VSQPALLFAAALTLVLGFAHSALGERHLIGPLLAPERRIPPLAGNFMRTVLRFAWHITSVDWIGMGAVLAILSFVPLEAQGRLAVGVIGAVFAVNGLIVLVASKGRHFAWMLFLLIGALCTSSVA
jgi:hypothetical protein